MTSQLAAQRFAEVKHGRPQSTPYSTAGSAPAARTEATIEEISNLEAVHREADGLPEDHLQADDHQTHHQKALRHGDTGAPRLHCHDWQSLQSRPKSSHTTLFRFCFVSQRRHHRGHSLHRPPFSFFFCPNCLFYHYYSILRLNPVVCEFGFYGIERIVGSVALFVREVGRVCVPHRMPRYLLFQLHTLVSPR